jgi:hypothetical protein
MAGTKAFWISVGALVYITTVLEDCAQLRAGAKHKAVKKRFLLSLSMLVLLKKSFYGDFMTVEIPTARVQRGSPWVLR